MNDILYVFAGDLDYMYALDTTSIGPGNVNFTQASVNLSNFENQRYGSAVVVDNKYIVNMGGFKSNLTYHIDVSTNNINNYTAGIVQESTIPIQSLYHGSSVYVPSSKRIYYLGGTKGFIPQITLNKIFYVQLNDSFLSSSGVDIHTSTNNPSSYPSKMPTSVPSVVRSEPPTTMPSASPTSVATSGQPTTSASLIPSLLPSETPFMTPTAMTITSTSARTSYVLFGCLVLCCLIGARINLLFTHA